jgi:hypothetical protein
MPVYKPESETMGADSTKSVQVIDNDYIITSIINLTVSTRPQRAINLLISGIVKSIPVIQGNETENITTLVVTIQIKE